MTLRAKTKTRDKDGHSISTQIETSRSENKASSELIVSHPGETKVSRLE